MFKVVDTRRNGKKSPFPKKRIRAANNPLRYVYFVTMGLFLAYFKMRATKKVVDLNCTPESIFCLYIPYIHLPES